MQNIPQHSFKEEKSPRRFPFSTLLQLLEDRASQENQTGGFFFLTEGESPLCLSYPDLHDRARRLATSLQNLDLSSRARIILLYPPGLEFISGFFGCIYSGGIAVPVPPPGYPRPEEFIKKFQNIIRDCQAQVVLTTAEILKIMEAVIDPSQFQRLHWIATDHLDPSNPAHYRKPPLQPGDLALLQYTSGSTGDPKGVMTSHANLLNNLHVIHLGTDSSEKSWEVSWIPHYHNFGLVTGILSPLYVAAKVTLLSPLDVVLNPFFWLQAMTQTRATHSGAPPFALDLCTTRITEEQKKSLELSSWKAAFIGGESIRPESLLRFAEAFAPCGFRPQVLMPGYGCSEATMLISLTEMDKGASIHSFSQSALQKNRVVKASLGDPDQKRLVACGGILPDETVMIVNPNTLKQCESDEIGEIWVSGPSVAQGYWRHPEDTERVFKGILAGQEKRTFLRTGDLGFIQDGELYLAGRLKDLIIVAGRNHYPQDIERTVQDCLLSLKCGGTAAFSVDLEGEEKLVIITELSWPQTSQDPESLLNAIEDIREAIARSHSIRAHQICFIEEGLLPKTASGKVQRHGCRDAFVQGTLPYLATG